MISRHSWNGLLWKPSSGICCQRYSSYESIFKWSKKMDKWFKVISNPHNLIAFDKLCLKTNRFKRMNRIVRCWSKAVSFKLRKSSSLSDFGSTTRRRILLLLWMCLTLGDSLCTIRCGCFTWTIHWKLVRLGSELQNDWKRIILCTSSWIKILDAIKHSQFRYQTSLISIKFSSI